MTYEAVSCSHSLRICSDPDYIHSLAELERFPVAHINHSGNKQRLWRQLRTHATCLPASQLDYMHCIVGSPQVSLPKASAMRLIWKVLWRS